MEFQKNRSTRAQSGLQPACPTDPSFALLLTVGHRSILRNLRRNFLKWQAGDRRRRRVYPPLFTW